MTSSNPFSVDLDNVDREIDLIENCPEAGVQVFGSRSLDLSSKGSFGIEDDDGEDHPVQGIDEENLAKAPPTSAKRRRTTEGEAPSKTSQNTSKSGKGKKATPPVIVEDESSSSESDMAKEDDAVPAVTRPVKKDKERRAPVWKHFHCKVKKNVLVQALCMYCGTSVPCHSKRNGTSSALTHFKSCKANPHNDKSNQKQSLLGFEPIGEGGVPSPYSGNWHFPEKSVADVAFAKKAIVDEDPFCVYEKPGWTEFLSPVVLPPYYRPPRRTKLTKMVLEMHAKMKGHLKGIFAKSNQRVSLTTDTWTAGNQNINYMCVTAHYINDEWELQKRIIGFFPITSHKGDDLGMALESCLKDWGLEKVFCVTMDNAPYNDGLGRYLKNCLVKWGSALAGGDHLHMRCAAHVINLVVTEGLKDHIGCVDRVRQAAAYMRRSPQRWHNFLAAAELEEVTSKKQLWLDSPTRWNGAYLMLQRAKHYKSAFKRYALLDKQFPADLHESGSGPPTNDDWDSVERLVLFLEHFFNLTKKVSGSWYNTANLYLPEISDMFGKIHDLGDSSCPHVKTMAKRMTTKFVKYWGDPEKMNMNIFFALIMDPRHRLSTLNFILENLYGADDAPRYENLIRAELARLFKCYSGKTNTHSGATTSSQQSTSTASTPAIGRTQAPARRTMAFLAEKMISSTFQGGITEVTELDRYLQDTPDFTMLNKPFDVLAWWKMNVGRFPQLSAMAKDVLAVPVSSVASESAFSTSGRVLNDFRSSLTPKSVEALICTQDWLFPRGLKKPTLEEDLDRLCLIETGDIGDDDDDWEEVEE